MRIHEHDDTHLWDGSFAKLAARSIDPTTDEVLILVEDEADANELHTDLQSELGEPIANCEIYTGPQENLNLDVDSFDVTVQVNPSRSPFKRHQPLYQATAVTRRGGTIIYQAPRSLAHSDGVDLGTIYILGWKDHQTPTLAALMTVSIEGTIGNTTPSSTPTPDNQPDSTAAETEQTGIDSFA